MKTTRPYFKTNPVQLGEVLAKMLAPQKPPRDRRGYLLPNKQYLTFQQLGILLKYLGKSQHLLGLLLDHVRPETRDAMPFLVAIAKQGVSITADQEARGLGAWGSTEYENWLV